MYCIIKRIIGMGNRNIIHYLRDHSSVSFIKYVYVGKKRPSVVHTKKTTLLLTNGIHGPEYMPSICAYRHPPKPRNAKIQSAEDDDDD